MIVTAIFDPTDDRKDGSALVRRHRCGVDSLHDVLSSDAGAGVCVLTLHPALAVLRWRFFQPRNAVGCGVLFLPIVPAPELPLVDGDGLNSAVPTALLLTVELPCFVLARIIHWKCIEERPTASIPVFNPDISWACCSRRICARSVFAAQNFKFSDVASARPPVPNMSHLHFRLSECQPVSGTNREESVWNNPWCQHR